MELFCCLLPQTSSFFSLTSDFAHFKMCKCLAKKNSKLMLRHGFRSQQRTPFCLLLLRLQLLESFVCCSDLNYGATPLGSNHGAVLWACLVSWMDLGSDRVNKFWFVLDACGQLRFCMNRVLKHSGIGPGGKRPE
jgi:hypothetical protein